VLISGDVGPSTQPTEPLGVIQTMNKEPPLLSPQLVPPNHQSTDSMLRPPPKTTLEEKLEGILFEREMRSDEFYSLIFDDLASQGILSNRNYDEMMRAFVDKTLSITERLSIRLFEGLKHDYVAVESTMFLDEAQRDIADYWELEMKVALYVMLTADEEGFSRDRFYDDVSRLIPLEGIDDRRRLQILERLMDTYLGNTESDPIPDKDQTFW
tara:strand:+ start:9302 stop:9937 length:636 start_codon:yes stop_codon:yes gene_type:complete